jgi:hypothetical protein
VADLDAPEKHDPPILDPVDAMIDRTYARLRARLDRRRQARSLACGQNSQNAPSSGRSILLGNWQPLAGEAVNTHSRTKRQMARKGPRSVGHAERSDELAVGAIAEILHTGRSGTMTKRSLIWATVVVTAGVVVLTAPRDTPLRITQAAAQTAPAALSEAQDVNGAAGVVAEIVQMQTRQRRALNPHAASQHR